MSSEAPPWYGEGHEEGLYLSGPQNAAVEAALTKAKARQHYLDDVMTEIGKKSAARDGQLVGLSHSLKGLGSARSKVARAELEEDDLDISRNTMDFNRYTVTFPAEQYADGATAVFGELRGRGFSAHREKNRGVEPEIASLAAATGVAVFRVAFERWVAGPDDADLADVMRGTLADLSGLTA